MCLCVPGMHGANASMAATAMLAYINALRCLRSANVCECDMVVSRGVSINHNKEEEKKSFIEIIPANVRVYLHIANHILLSLLFLLLLLLLLVGHTLIHIGISNAANSG